LKDQNNSDSIENSQLGNINISIIHKTETGDQKEQDWDEISRKEDPSFLEDLSKTFKDNRI